ncbi:MAG: flagellar basal body-associated FliL family protein [Deltaproteobacteria bacterium]|nr:flagellar basal body-associated FliL family protein [Deltaproteobacteria bacterium]
MTDESEQEYQPKSSKVVIIVVVVAVVVLAAVGIVLAVTLSSSNAKASKSDDKQNPASRSANQPGPLVKLDNFIVNIASDEGGKYLKTALVLELGSPDDASSLEKSEMLVRNEVLMYLSSLDVEGTQTVKQKKALQKRLKKLINKRLKRNIVNGVYFTEFVAQ